MSSYALGSVFAARQISDEQFRVLAWLAEHDHDGFVQAKIVDLAERTEKSENQVAVLLADLPRNLPALAGLRLSRPGDSIAGMEFVSGPVDWEQLS